MNITPSFDDNKQIEAAAEGLRRLYSTVLPKDGFNEDVAQAYILDFRVLGHHNLRQMNNFFPIEESDKRLYDQVLGEVSAVEFDRSIIPLPFEIRDADAQEQDIRRHNQFERPTFQLRYLINGAINGRTELLDAEAGLHYFSEHGVFTDPLITPIGYFTGSYNGELTTVETPLSKELFSPESENIADDIQTYLVITLARKIYLDRFTGNNNEMTKCAWIECENKAAKRLQKETTVEPQERGLKLTHAKPIQVCEVHYLELLNSNQGYWSLD